MADDLRALIFQAGPASAIRGWVGLVASERGLRLLGLPASTYQAALRHIREHYSDVALVPDDPFLLDVAEQVRAYLDGTRREFSVDLDLRGHTPFALSVWAAAARIGYGEIRTYAWIAAQIGDSGPGTAQAVGAALSANPVALIIPCHRVIGSDGSLHGYAGGLEMKARLLAMESGQETLGL